MTEHVEPRPELHEVCKSDLRRAACPTYPVTCRDQQELWDSGYAAAVKRAEDAEDAYREADARCARLELDYTAEMSAREAEAKLAATQRCLRSEADARIAYQDKLRELVRRVREWWSDGEPCGKQLRRILNEYDKPEGE
jgi:hypothetical protein